jgi:hypothetical protein
MEVEGASINFRIEGKKMPIITLIIFFLTTQNESARN